MSTEQNATQNTAVLYGLLSSFLIQKETAAKVTGCKIFLYKVIASCPKAELNVKIYWSRVAKKKFASNKIVITINCADLHYTRF